MWRTTKEQEKMDELQHCLREMAKSLDDRRLFRRSLGAFLTAADTLRQCTPARDARAGQDTVVSPDDARRLLEDGNARFVKGASMHPNTSAQRMAETTSGQKPFAAILSCADSRVSPELVFDRGIGDIFVVRNAGNVVEPAAIDSLAYAVGHLHVSLVTVMGHGDCGAVRTAIAGGTENGFLSHILDIISPVVSRVRSLKPGLAGDSLVQAVVQANISNSIDGLLRESEVISRAVRQRDAMVLGAVYDTSNGRVAWLSR